MPRKTTTTTKPKTVKQKGPPVDPQLLALRKEFPTLEDEDLLMVIEVRRKSTQSQADMLRLAQQNCESGFSLADEVRNDAR